ncbi:MAG: thioesterase domain-containing protein [Steroidobacteraceae bacterium]|jgi:thioesterase domain-containing protein|nr:thioesterase domain-containing protein [Steroidobacteraceae bacterium]
MTDHPAPLPTPATLEAYLHQHIPITRAMQVTVTQIDHDQALLAAPLAPNINHRDTAFGGSVAALATLAGWTLLHARLTTAGLPSRLVIQRSTMEFEAPVPTDFSATARLADSTAWVKFEQMLRRKGRGRIAVVATLHCDDVATGKFQGEFVAVRLASPDSPAAE